MTEVGTVFAWANVGSGAETIAQVNGAAAYDQVGTAVGAADLDGDDAGDLVVTDREGTARVFFGPLPGGVLHIADAFTTIPGVHVDTEADAAFGDLLLANIVSSPAHDLTLTREHVVATFDGARR